MWEEEDFPFPVEVTQKKSCSAPTVYYRYESEQVVQLRLSGNQQSWGGLEGPQPLHFKSAAATCAVRGEFLRSGACPAGSKSHLLRLCRPGLRGPGKLSCGQFSPSNGPAGPGKTREAKARGFPTGGSEGPENRPVACFHRRTGRQALDRKTPCDGVSISLLF